MAARQFGSIQDVIAALDPSYPVFCIYPEVIADRARLFLESFPGKVLYAVKCNPHPIILDTLYKAGIRDFDTASLPEISRVAERYSEANCYFNHPVKGSGALETAVKVYGIQDFVVDHPDELDKVVGIAGTDITIEVRLATSGLHAAYNLSSKFGAPADSAVDLLKRAAQKGARTAIAFHVGSQCLDPVAFWEAIELAAEVRDRAAVPIAYLNVGGGFPAAYEQSVPALDLYFTAIRDASARYWEGVPLYCEPGRALVADAGTLLAQVHLRRGSDIYLNDGIYGCLSELRDAQLHPETVAIGRGRALTRASEPFRVFGPTCDSLDVLPAPFYLPGDIAAGDWIEVRTLGAYSLALATGFNGFLTDTVVAVAGQP